MLTKRIIPCLDIQGGRTVKGVNFIDIRDAGDPVGLAYNYAQKGADELVLLDISATNEQRRTFTILVSEVARQINIPFTVGGGITCIDDVARLLEAGADKVSINSAAVMNPGLINDLSKAFGSQCIVVAIDARVIENEWRVHTHGGNLATENELFSWAKQCEERGAGEILFTSMDHDGVKKGYAVEALRKLHESLSIPVIASGGAGTKEDFAEIFIDGHADAALAASVFHFNEIEISDLKQFLKTQQIPVRL